MALKYPAVPAPTTDPASLRDSTIALKQGFEILTGQVGDGSAAAPMPSDLALKADKTYVDAQDALKADKTYVDALSYNNIIINGGMEVDQANAGALVSAVNGYAIDCWACIRSGTMVTASQQVSDAPAGFSNSLKVTVTTAQSSLGSGDYTVLYTKIEGYRTSKLAFGSSSAQTVSIGFWVKAHRTGAYSGAIQNNANNRTYPFSFTQNVADTWEYKTVTIPGDTTGTWVGNTNGCGLIIYFSLAVGSTYQGTANTWAGSLLMGVTGTTNGVAATSDVFQITGVTLLPGTVAPTAAQSVLLKLPYDQASQLCKRYWEAVGMTVVVSSPSYLNTAWYKATKRVSPTLTVISGSANGATIGGLPYDAGNGLRQVTPASSNADIQIAADARL